jgi:hypothetical protein
MMSLIGKVGCCRRGQLSGGFAQHCLVGSAFRQCTACSWAVVDQYRQRGRSFILDALQVSTFHFMLQRGMMHLI